MKEAWLRQWTVRNGRLTTIELGPKPNVRWLLNPVPNTSDSDVCRLFTRPGCPVKDDPVSAPSIINGLVYISTDQGHLMVYADPSIVPAAGTTCDDTSLSPTTCSAAGGHLVSTPAQLVDIALPDHGDAAYFRKEVVLAEGMALVATTAGHLYAYTTTAHLPFVRD